MMPISTCELAADHRTDPEQATAEDDARRAGWTWAV